MEREVLQVRQDRRLGPARIAGVLDVPASTVHRILARYRMPKLAWLDRPTGEPIRRYERDRPGELVHVDVKKLGRLREGGGWWAHGRGSDQHKAARRAPRVGVEFVHCAVDDHSRLAYAEIHPGETATTCADFLRRAAAVFAAHGIPAIERIMTDNALAYRRSHAFRTAVTDIGAHQRFTRAYRPQTNGKSRTLQSHSRRRVGLRPPFTSSHERTAAPPDFLHNYNHHRAHTALNDQRQ
ncbi:DDE-type integrase/transposase/recombinase [Amycolatopsis tucumanensis]|uniref:DDE-type integrase/transposase/recombinase n=1 Tax=Amycolatopsis tucumanensis TaxID=401106 RepID=UPI003D711CBB